MFKIYKVDYLKFTYSILFLSWKNQHLVSFFPSMHFLNSTSLTNFDWKMASWRFQIERRYIKFLFSPFYALFPLQKGFEQPKIREPTFAYPKLSVLPFSWSLRQFFQSPKPECLCWQTVSRAGTDSTVWTWKLSYF